MGAVGKGRVVGAALRPSERRLPDVAACRLGAPDLNTAFYYKMVECRAFTGRR
jgi:hypothetical protein